MKRLALIICAVAICMTAAVCYVTFSNKNNTKQDLTNTTSNVPVSVKAVTGTTVTENPYTNINRASSCIDLAVVYRNEEEKLLDEDLSAVAGTVTNTEVILAGVVYTCCTVKIDKVIKGSFDTDTIRVLERGGYLNSEQAEKFMNKPGAKSKNGMYVDCEGYVPASVGDKVIFFVKKCPLTDGVSRKMKVDNLYYTAGVIQGKLTLKDGKYVSATPETLVESFEDTEYKISTKSFTPDEFEQMAKKVAETSKAK